MTTALFFADFHAHSIMSDGSLLPEELLRRAMINGATAFAIADHVGWSNCEAVVAAIVRACTEFRSHTGLQAIPAVEITHVPPEGIAGVARLAKSTGARLVVVHGETAVEPVAPGTNHAAVGSPDVDLLAHPGFLTPEDAALAGANGVFVEISARKGHSLTNGHVVQVGRAAGARFLIDSDAHEPGDLLTPAFARLVGLGAGLTAAEVDAVMSENAAILLARAER